MKERHTVLLLWSVLLLVAGPVHAQLTLDGTNCTNLGYVSNYGGFTAIASAPGSSYNVGSGAVLDHFKSESNSLRVDKT